MLVSYQKAKALLREDLKSCRDRDIRTKANLVLLACRLGNVSEACARRGFSRPFFYKWYGRLKREKWNLRALQERTRRPKSRAKNRTKEKIEAQILALGKIGYGAPSIQAILRRRGTPIARSTVIHILGKRRKRSGTRKKEKLKRHKRRYELPVPGMRLQLDVKYVPEKVEGFRAYNYVVIDECTRMRYAHAYLDLNPKNTVDFLGRAKDFFPFDIACIQTDNGFEFTNRLIPSHINSEHPMDEWCRENAITHQLIPPGVKELNGKVERSHRIDEEHFYWRAPTESLDEFNKALDCWLIVYNHEKLHGSLGFITPIEKLWAVYEANRKALVPDLNILKDLPKRFQAYKNKLRSGKIWAQNAA